MKKFLIAASCLALVAPTFSMAQMNTDQKGRDQGQQGHPARQGGGNQNRSGSGAPAGGGGYRPNTGAPNMGGGNRAGPVTGANRTAPAWTGGSRPSTAWSAVNRPGRPANPGYGSYRPAGNRPGGWAGNDRSWGWNGNRFRAGRFNYPTGYRYQRWGRGQILPLIFLSAAYYFTDYAALGLEPAPWGYQWVRYGPDVMLVNISTGEVMDVEYNVFY